MRKACGLSTSEFVTQTSVPAIWPFAAIIGAGIHSARSTTLTRLEIWQRWWATVALGCGSAWMALSFLLAPTVMTTAIGFAQTPFVTEIDFANLGLAVGGFRALHAGRRERITIGLVAGMSCGGGDRPPVSVRRSGELVSRQYGWGPRLRRGHSRRDDHPCRPQSPHGRRAHRCG